MSFAPQPKGRHCISSTAIPDQPKATPRRSSRKRMCSRYLDEDMVTLEDSSLWSPALSRALQERYGDSSRKRTPRSLTRLMQQHRENERHRHHGLNASIRAISQRIPGFDEDNKETKIVKLQRIINYISHLEQHIKKDCDDIGFSLDYKNLFLSPHITKNPDEWKPGPKSSPPQNQPVPKKYTTFCRNDLKNKDQSECAADQEEGGGSPMQQPVPPCPPHLSPGASCGHSLLHKHQPSRHQASSKAPRGKYSSRRSRSSSSRAARDKGHQKGTDLVPWKTLPTGGKAGQDLGHTLTDLLPYPADGAGVTGLSHGCEEEDLDWLDSMMESATADMNDMCREVLHLPDLLPDLGEPQQIQPAPRHHMLSPPTCEHGPGHHLLNLDTWQHGSGKHILYHQCLPHGPGHYMMNQERLQQHSGHYLMSPKSLQHSSRLYLMSPGQCFVSPENLQYASNQHVTGPERLQHVSDRHLTDPESLQHDSDLHLMGPESLQHGSDQHLMGPESLQHGSNQHLMGPESLQHGSDQHLMGPESLQHGSDQHLMRPESLQHGFDQHLMRPESLQHGSDQHLMRPESLQHDSDQHLMRPESLQHGSDQHLMRPESLQHGSDQHLMRPESLQHGSDQHLMHPESLQHGSDQHLMRPESLQHGSDQHLMRPVSLQHGSDQHLIGPEPLQYSPRQYLASPESLQHSPGPDGHQEQVEKTSPTGQDTIVYHPVPCRSSPPPPREDESTNVSPRLVDVSSFHSYARINNDVTVRGKLLNEWELEMDEEGSVSPHALTIHHPADPHTTLLTTQHYPTALSMQIQLDDDDLMVEMGTRGQHRGLAVPRELSADDLTLPPGEIQAGGPNDPHAPTCYGESGDEPARVDLRKTSWMNGFMMYSRLHRKQYIDGNPGVHTSHISRLMGVDWRKLTFSDQQPYKEKAQIYVENHLMPQLVTTYKRNEKSTKKH